MTKVHFTHRLWIATTNKWGIEANQALLNQQPPVSRISLTDLVNAPVDWVSLVDGSMGEKARLGGHKLKPHQQEALDNAKEYYKSNDRGKMIMACGTGKTFTSLRLAEQETGGKGLILFLVPSISLLGQTLREWTAQSVKPIKAICVCSDSEVSKTKKMDDSTDSIVDLALPASTNVHSLLSQLQDQSMNTAKAGMTVVFSTYQSIEVISKAQKKFGKPFDLIICDEAHRTTGVTFVNDEESAFVKVHDNKFLQASKRLYMTATPRIYGEGVKAKAKEIDAELCSMDNADYYGEEFYRIGFGKAVENLLLSDYKVLILTVHEERIPKAFQKALAQAENAKEIPTDEVMKLAGCINALSKSTVIQDTAVVKEIDPEPMRRAVAFCQSIKNSKALASAFNACKELFYEQLSPEERQKMIDVTADHVDGTMSALTREDKLSWLKSSPKAGRECRILNNVRCLSEGVDVPSLDAVLFLSPRNSQVDVVQSVGRVMRTSPGKKYGYIIIPVLIPAGTQPEDALDDNDRFRVVWTVLNALRAHDDRFDALINKINLNKRLPDQVSVIDNRGGSSAGQTWDDEEHKRFESEVNKKNFSDLGALCHVIFAKMVEKVGNKRYWEQWARDVAKIAERHIEQITAFIGQGGAQQKAFDQFMKGLHQNINPSISQEDAIQMLAQHLITKPVFDALFENYKFVENNPVSKAMQGMLDKLDSLTLEKDRVILHEFYQSVKMRTKGIDNGEAKQKIIVELYDKFFKTAFPKVVEKLGIVYTPVEVVDFMLHSVADVLKAEFNRDLSDENIHILDPFTGTGTFMTRLIQSKLISQKALERKYEKEFHANEIVLLAYYIASINMENAYHERTPDKPYKPFEGICLTDTFHLGEGEGILDLNDGFIDNTRRVKAQRKAPLRIIIGNPPYSVGQKSANDNAQNQSYPNLEKRIEETYVTETKSTLVRSLYDSYIKAFRWASDRLDPQGGIVAFVSNGSWLDGNAMAGFRKTLQKEFSAIYVFNLRGNCRTQGELRQREGGGIFGLGSRTPITITLLVKNPSVKTPAVIHYHDIGDYLPREEKLETIRKFGSISKMTGQFQILQPNKHGDWISHRDEGFEELIPLDAEKKYDDKAKSVFVLFSRGLATSRDPWNYNSSKNNLVANIKRTIAFYNSQTKAFIQAKNRNSELKVEDFLEYDSTQFNWDRSQKQDAEKGKEYAFNSLEIYTAVYRPFFKQNSYFSAQMNNCMYQLSRIFPTSKHENLLICLPGVGVTKEFDVSITDCLPDVQLMANGQCFPLYYYEKNDKQEQMSLFDTSEEYTRRDGISDFILERVRELCGSKVTKEDIFYYVYGILHSPEYRTKYAVNLKKTLPRLPLPEEPKLFWTFSKAGRELADLHLNYETLAPYKGLKEDSPKAKPSYRVDKMRFAKEGKEENKTAIILNDDVTVWNIPLEAYEYVVNGKSAIEWIIERYAVTTHKESQITNDPNLWCDEHKNPRYIIDLLKSIVTLSIETMKIVKSLPKLGL
jgi:predicted helicase